MSALGPNAEVKTQKEASRLVKATRHHVISLLPWRQAGLINISHRRP
jgi:hypothetical protein